MVPAMLQLPNTIQKVGAGAETANGGFSVAYGVAPVVCFVATRKTGEAHWQVLMRARAIENGSFVFAAAQAGRHESGRETYGHSLIVNPWGEIIAEAGVDPAVIVADIAPSEVAAARQRIPSLQHDRPFQISRAAPDETKEAS